MYLEPNEENLRHVVEISRDFYKLSGLKISVNKTKAIWIGSKVDSKDILCPELELKWVKKCTLLRVNFDNALENMEDNFLAKI